MASSTQYWSDEDEDDATQIERSIHLGVPDGPVEAASDLNDAAVSRIGGLPVRLISTQPCTSILLNISRPRRCFPMMLRLTRASVRTVGTPWNSWCSFGHPSKIARTIEQYMRGAAQEGGARRRAEGMFPYTEQICGDQRETMRLRTASGLGEVCVTTKNTHQNLSARSLESRNRAGRRKRC